MAERKILNLGTRSSPLAMAQAHLAKNRICNAFPELEVNLCGIKTTGDKDRVRSLVQFGGTGVFVKELEEVLLEGRIDFAVHSLKDVPEAFDSRLMLGGFLPRACPYDVLISQNKTLEDLPYGAKIGTGSPRRILQLKEKRPDLKFQDLRGNLDSRIGKVKAKELDAILLSAAGLERLSLTDVITERFAPDIVTPAVGQGIVGLQCRKDDIFTQEILRQISDKDASEAAFLERTWMKFLGGGCRVPMAAFASMHSDKVEFFAYLADPNSQRFYRKKIDLVRNSEIEKSLKNFGEEFLLECKKRNIPWPREVSEHALLDFWGKL